ncbi:MAG: thioesterase family protein [Deltaproteobacteria bacterium]|jgi:acyl-CoA thioesterase
MRLDRTLRDRWSREDDAWTFTMPEGWGQGRSVFGGFTAAAAVALAHRDAGDDRRLRTVSMQLIRPTKPGPTKGRCTVVREGANVRFVEVRLAQDDADVAAVSAVFVAPRAGSTDAPPLPAWDGPDVESLVDLPYIEGVIPEFTQHVQMRWADGLPPFSNGKEARFRGYCRGPFGDAEGLVALLDVWPSPSLALLSGPAPASTVSWTAHLLEVPADFERWFRFSYETVAGRDGFHTSVGALHDADGRLVGWTEQLVAVFG